MTQIDPQPTLAPRARHIRELLNDLYDAQEHNRPWSLVRLGDGELKVLAQEHAPFTHYENAVATQEDLADLRVWSIKAILEADWVGWHQDPFLTVWMEAVGALPAAYEHSVYAWVNLHLSIRRSFVEKVLRNEKLFLVGFPMQRWLDEYLRPRGLGAQAQVYKGNTSISTIREFYHVCKTIEATDAKVILCSMGIWAVPMAGFVKRIGRIGIDAGHWPDHNLSPNQSWNYHVNTETDDTPEGTREWYARAHCPLSLPE